MNSVSLQGSAEEFFLWDMAALSPKGCSTIGDVEGAANVGCGGQMFPCADREESSHGHLGTWPGSTPYLFLIYEVRYKALTKIKKLPEIQYVNTVISA